MSRHATAHPPYKAPRASTRTENVVDFLFYLVYVGLGLRIVLVFLRARPDAPFARWVNDVTEPLHAPFQDLFPTVNIGDRFTLALSALFAFAVCVVLHYLVRALLRALTAERGAG